ncbi:hypothetical protein F4803DRAFT_511524 [Xylaria telfairii]|nr:hypothetical protein F4803DRAFT_511524 [Xylaria telfairii]
MHCTRCQKLAIWQSILKGYTELELTFPKDRLPALSGLAQKLRGDEDKYLAGVWESALPDSLFWNQDVSNTVISESPKPLAAPTWSWASISSARLRKEHGYYHSCRSKRDSIFSIRVESIDVQPATANLYGTVNANARLVISGTLALGFLRFRQRRPVLVISRTTTEIQFEPDYKIEHLGQYYVSQGTALVCLYQTANRAEVPTRYHTGGLIFRGVGEGSLMYERIGYVPSHRIEPEEFATMHTGTLTLV